MKVESLIEDPLGSVVEDCFRKQLDKTLSEKKTELDSGFPDELLNCLAKEEWGTEEAFGDLFSEESYQKVKWLTQASIKNGEIRHHSLVRFRCMVQDIFDPEYFVGFYQVRNSKTKSITVKTTKYADEVCVNPDETLVETKTSQSAGVMERTPVYCVPVPAESEWTKTNRVNHVNSSSNNTNHRRLSTKRSVDAGMEVDSEKKSKVGKEENKNDENENAENHSKNSQKNLDVGKSIDANAEKEHEKENDQNLAEIIKKWTPFGQSENEVSCIVKLYDNQKVQLNELVEFVGVLSLSSQAFDKDTATSTAFDAFSAAESHARRPPCSLVPRLHCISMRKFNPMDDMNVYADAFKMVDSSIPKSIDSYTIGDIERVRRQTLDFLVPVCGGDSIAAEYLLLWMLSGMDRKDQPECIGRLNLCLCNFGNPDDTGAGMIVNEVVSKLLPRCRYIGLSVSSLQAGRYSPYKDYDSNRLYAGNLQTVSNTPVIVDETQLNSGQLLDVGVKNINALNQLIMHQTVTYDFNFYTNDWKVNMPVLVICSGKKSILSETNCVLPIKSKNYPSMPPQMISPKVYDSCRLYLAMVRTLKLKPFDITEEMGKIIEQDFVKWRQADSTITQDHLHSWLNLSRFVEQSYGSSVCTKRGWETVQKLERERMNRIAGK